MQPSTTLPSPISTPIITIAPTHIPTSATTYTPASTTPYTFTTATTNNQAATTTHVLNSRDRNNSLKHSGASKELEDSNNRKLKITISPKYNTGEQQDNKHDNIAVADFKLNNGKMEESTEANTNKYPSSSTITTAYPPKSTTYAPTITNNFNAVTNANGTKFKLDSHFTNVTQTGNTVVTENREVHQEVRDRPQEHAMIRMERYERI